MTSGAYINEKWIQDVSLQRSPSFVVYYRVDLH